MLSIFSMSELLKMSRGLFNLNSMFCMSIVVTAIWKCFLKSSSDNLIISGSDSCMPSNCEFSESFFEKWFTIRSTSPS